MEELGGFPPFWIPPPTCAILAPSVYKRRLSARLPFFLSSFHHSQRSRSLVGPHASPRLRVYIFLPLTTSQSYSVDIWIGVSDDAQTTYLILPPPSSSTSPSRFFNHSSSDSYIHIISTPLVIQSGIPHAARVSEDGYSVYYQQPRRRHNGDTRRHRHGEAALLVRHGRVHLRAVARRAPSVHDRAAERARERGRGKCVVGECERDFVRLLLPSNRIISHVLTNGLRFARTHAATRMRTINRRCAGIAA